MSVASSKVNSSPVKFTWFPLVEPTAVLTAVPEESWHLVAQVGLVCLPSASGLVMVTSPSAVL